MDNYIEFDRIKKIFPGQIVLKDVSFSIKRGEIHALLGENGAGKSTLLNIFHGLFPATSGEIRIDGKAVHFSHAYEAISSGIAKVHQEINLVSEMTVFENLLLGNEIEKGPFLDKRSMKAETQLLLDRLKCSFTPDTLVKQLNLGEKQMLQIAKALHHKAHIISFDEPTSSLSNHEVETLFEIINQLKLEGITIIYISHKLDEIFRICDRATILRDGQYQGTYEIKDLSKEAMVNKMVGRNVEMFAKRQRPCVADYSQVVLYVRDASGQDGFKQISFKLHKGEILGFFGLVGAKRTETMSGIFGAKRLLNGEIYLNNKKVRINSPTQAIKYGIGMLPENRKEHGFVKDFNNLDNISLATLDKFSSGLFQNRKRKFKNAFLRGKTVGLSPNDPDFMTKNLSGGNQQKVIIAKWLTTEAEIIIFDEPTKGIDVGAKSDIYAMMEDLVAEGKSIIMISSELPEVIGMSDRIIVMHEGRISGQLNRDEFSESDILYCAVGGK